jgi:hypothetical protein
MITIKTNNMSKIIFIWWLLNGTITPAGEHEDHKLYTVWFKDGKVADHMYKGEVLHYIETGDLEYNEEYEFESLKADRD